MMSNTEYIAEREMRAIDKNGNHIDITIGLGAPYPREDMEAWECPVKADGLYTSLANSTGVDSWQALQLAKNLLIQLLSTFIEDGGRIYPFGDSEEINLSELHEYF
jgi:hypothetical protein